MKMKTKVLLFLFHTSRLLINTNTSLATGAVLTAVETRKKIICARRSKRCDEALRDLHVWTSRSSPSEDNQTN
jgi:hypothetical protein